jgi:hypothetical protein
VLLFSLPLPALAETREERLAVAEDYVEQTLQSFDMTALVDTMYRPIVLAAAQQGNIVSPEEEAQILQLLRDTFTGPMTDLMRAQAPMMADMMTLSELVALREFYASPEGRSVMEKLPQVIALQQPQIMEMLNATLTELTPKLEAIIGD